MKGSFSTHPSEYSSVSSQYLRWSKLSDLQKLNRYEKGRATYAATVSHILNACITLSLSSEQVTSELNTFIQFSSQTSEVIELLKLTQLNRTDFFFVHFLL